MMTSVAAGVLERDGKILICQRREDQPHALKWEFPGGKMELGESAPVGLVRELREELGIEAEIGRELTRYEFSYAGRLPILLIFLEVTAWRGAIENRIFRSLLWEEPLALQSYDFLEGDRPFLSTLVSSQSARGK